MSKSVYSSPRECLRQYFSQHFYSEHEVKSLLSMYGMRKVCRKERICQLLSDMFLDENPLAFLTYIDGQYLLYTPAVIPGTVGNVLFRTSKLWKLIDHLHDNYPCLCAGRIPVSDSWYTNGYPGKRTTAYLCF